MTMKAIRALATNAMLPVKAFIAVPCAFGGCVTAKGAHVRRPMRVNLPEIARDRINGYELRLLQRVECFAKRIEIRLQIKGPALTALINHHLDEINAGEVGTRCNQARHPSIFNAIFRR